MPFANKFRAMMNFPFPGDLLGDFTVEQAEVVDEREDSEGHVYGVQMVLQGPGGVQAAQRALRALFSQRQTTFSGYGNPYQLWFRKPEIKNLGGQRYAVSAKGAGVRVVLEPELRRFLGYLNAGSRLVEPLDAAAQDALIEEYLERYRHEIQRQVERYTRNRKDTSL